MERPTFLLELVVFRREPDDSGQVIGVQNYDAGSHAGRVFCFQGHPLVFCNYKTKRKHFRHLPSQQTDAACAGKGKWHAAWQAQFEETEVYVGGSKAHRADAVLSARNVVVEFQHSPISEQIVAARNAHYLALGYNVVWVLDFTAFAHSEYLVAPTQPLFNITKAEPATLVVADFGCGVAEIQHADFSVPDKPVVRFGRLERLLVLLESAITRKECRECGRPFLTLAQHKCLEHNVDLRSRVRRLIFEEQLAELLAVGGAYPRYRYHDDVLRSAHVSAVTDEAWEARTSALDKSHKKRPCHRKRCECRRKYIVATLEGEKGAVRDVKHLVETVVRRWKKNKFASLCPLLMLVVRFFIDQQKRRSRFPSRLLIAALTEFGDELLSHCDEVCGCRVVYKGAQPGKDSARLALPDTKLAYSDWGRETAAKFSGKKTERVDKGTHVCYQAQDGSASLALSDVPAELLQSPLN